MVFKTYCIPSLRFKRDRYTTRKRRMDGLHIFRLKKDIKKRSAQEITMEVGTHWRIERNNKERKETIKKRREMRTVVKDEKSEWKKEK